MLLAEWQEVMEDLDRLGGGVEYWLPQTGIYRIVAGVWRDDTGPCELSLSRSR